MVHSIPFYIDCEYYRQQLGESFSTGFELMDKASYYQYAYVKDYDHKLKVTFGCGDRGEEWGIRVPV